MWLSLLVTLPELCDGSVNKISASSSSLKSHVRCQSVGLFAVVRLARTVR